jgi:hypothetical protein
MQKFNEHFDEIKASHGLKEEVLARAREQKTPWYKRVNFKAVLAASLIIIVAIIPVIAIVASLGGDGDLSIFNQAHQVQSVEHLQQLLEFRDDDWGDFRAGGGNLTLDTVQNGALPPSSPSSDGGSSTTNVQIAGIDEGDIIKNDGNRIYRLSPSGLTIVQTNNGFITPLTSVEYQNFSPIEMYVRGNTMVIIGGTFNYAPTNWSMATGGFLSFYQFHQRVIIKIYNISNITSPVLRQYYEIDGSYHTSRLQEATETLFFVVNYNPFGFDFNMRQSEVRRPYFRNCINEEFVPFPVSSMFYFEDNPTRSLMVLGSIELNKPQSNAHTKAYLSSADIISVGTNNLYTVSTRWENVNGQGIPQAINSYIARFSLTNLAHTGYVSVRGALVDRHAIDEHNGYLRVATTYIVGGVEIGEEINFASAVFVFNSNLKETSRILGIAPDEMIDSVTFVGNFGYISTSPAWLIYDPLYTVNLTNPYRITISEGLETDGINEYLKAIPNTPFAIGIGRDSLAGGSAMQTGIKIELYDMKTGTGEMPQSLAKFTIYGRMAFAEILFNPRALLFMYCENTKQGIVGFAAESADFSSPNWQYTVYSQGFYLFSFDANNGTMSFLGDKRTVQDTSGANVEILLPTFSNFNLNQNILPISFENDTDWLVRWQAQIAAYANYISRAVVNNGFIYTVSNNVIAGYCLTTLAQIDKHIGN